jgi:class 3 adenylate cyclase
MAETRKIAAILVADVAGYSQLAGADEEGTLARLPELRSDVIDPAIATHRVPHRHYERPINESHSDIKFAA